MLISFKITSITSKSCKKESFQQLYKLNRLLSVLNSEYSFLLNQQLNNFREWWRTPVNQASGWLLDLEGTGSNPDWSKFVFAGFISLDDAIGRKQTTNQPILRMKK